MAEHHGRPKNRNPDTEENEEGEGRKFRLRNLSDRTNASGTPFPRGTFDTFCESKFGVRVETAGSQPAWAVRARNHPCRVNHRVGAIEDACGCGGRLDTARQTWWWEVCQSEA